MNMKITSLLLFTGNICAFSIGKGFDLGLDSFDTGCGNGYGAFNGGRNIGRYFGLPDGPRRNFYNENYLIPYVAFDSHIGLYSKDNLLRANFHLLSNHLRYALRHFGNASSDTAHERITTSIDDAGVEIYRIFKKCLFLVDYNDYAHYKKVFEEARYTECFYLIYKNLKNMRHPFDYLNILRDNSCQGLTSNCFYQSKEKNIIDTNLSINNVCNMPSADFLNDPVCILDLDLYERVQLLKYFFCRYYCHARGSNLNERIVRFIRLYQDVYLTGYPRDHRVTAFVLYKIYSELRFKNHNPLLIDRMYDFLSSYFSGENGRIADFFCRLTFGRYEK